MENEKTPKKEKKTEKLFVVLSRKDNLRPDFEQMLKERERTFDKKPDHFAGLKKVFTSALEEIKEDDQKYVDGSFDINRYRDELVDPVTSVTKQLNFVESEAVDYINALLTVERTNASGIVKAKLFIEDQYIGEFSTGELLALQKVVYRLKDIYSKIPTTNPKLPWKKEKTELGAYETEAARTVQGTNVTTFIKVAEANQYQKQAEVRETKKNLVVGYYDKVDYSTAMSPAEKNTLLQRVSNLIVALDEAIKRANDVHVVEATEASKIFNYLHKDIK